MMGTMMNARSTNLSSLTSALWQLPTLNLRTKMANPNDTPTLTKPLMAGCQQEPCSPSLADRLRLTAYAPRPKVETIHNEAADEIERLRSALLEIAKRGANPMTGYGYGIEKPWARLADDVWRIARESLLEN
jgi:hypothetical protein